MAKNGKKTIEKDGLTYELRQVRIERGKRPCGFIVIDKRVFSETDADKAANMLGITRADLIGHAVDSVVIAKQAAIRRMLIAGKAKMDNRTAMRLITVYTKTHAGLKMDNDEDMAKIQQDVIDDWEKENKPDLSKVDPDHIWWNV